MRTAAGEKLRDMYDDGTRRSHTNPKIVIEDVVKIIAEMSAAAVPDVTAEEDFRLVEEAGGEPKAIEVEQQPKRKLDRQFDWQLGVVIADDLVALTTDLATSAHHDVDMM